MQNLQISYIFIRRISIRKCEQLIQTNTYILTFNKPHTPNKVKISYCLKRVEQYIQAHLRCFKCQKYGHHREACREQQTCAKFGEKGHGRHGGRLQERNYMCKLLTRSSSLCKILHCLLKRNNWGETQEECFLPGSKENCRELYGRKQLCLCCTESG